MPTTRDRRRAHLVETSQLITGICTALATIFSLAAAIAAGWSAHLSKQQLVASTRPWLAVDDPKIALIPHTANPESQFTLKNYGQGPITRTQFAFYMLYVKPEDSGESTVAHKIALSDQEVAWMSFGALAPGQTIPFYTDRGGLQQISTESTAIPPQRGARYMRLLFQYYGLGEQVHHTYLCYELGWEPEPLQSTNQCTFGQVMD